MSQQQFIPTPKFEEYKERFKEFYKMQRRVDGVILVEAHTDGGPIQLSVENHRSVGQMLKAVGADPENEIMIFTGSGDEFMMDADPEGFKLEAEDLPYSASNTPTRMAASTSVQWSTISNSDDWGDQWSGVSYRDATNVRHHHLQRRCRHL